MSLYDANNPQHLRYLRQHLRRRDPAAPLDPDDFCQGCDEPHLWCTCEDTMTAPARFKKEDLARAVSGCTKGGMKVGRVEIDPAGNIVILSEAVAPPADPNPWDKAVGA